MKMSTLGSQNLIREDNEGLAPRLKQKAVAIEYIFPRGEWNATERRSYQPCLVVESDTNDLADNQGSSFPPFRLRLTLATIAPAPLARRNSRRCTNTKEETSVRPIRGIANCHVQILGVETVHACLS